jgi:hypothetical protein
MRNRDDTYFAGEGVALDLMLRALVVLRSVMNINFLELIAVELTNLEDRQKYLHATWCLDRLETPAIGPCCGAFP